MPRDFALPTWRRHCCMRKRRSRALLSPRRPQLLGRRSAAGCRNSFPVCRGPRPRRRRTRRGSTESSTSSEPLSARGEPPAPRRGAWAPPPPAATWRLALAVWAWVGVRQSRTPRATALRWSSWRPPFGRRVPRWMPRGGVCRCCWADSETLGQVPMAPPKAPLRQRRTGARGTSGGGPRSWRPWWRRWAASWTRASGRCKASRSTPAGRPRPRQIGSSPRICVGDDATTRARNPRSIEGQLGPSAGARHFGASAMSPGMEGSEASHPTRSAVE
mmetsp:Transcript_50806/g.164324  ORF Transcript_50806/g.164324 Transcript_50806/m.164324 type:complete len:274 (-) Transcript_50806:37-858(-)